MLKLIIIYIVALEIAQLISMLLICICFFLCKYIFHITDATFQYMLRTVSYKKIVVGCILAEIISLIGVIPFSFWWFSLWNMQYQLEVSSSLPILYFVLFLGKIVAVKKYMMGRNKDKDIRSNHIYY